SIEHSRFRPTVESLEVRDTPGFIFGPVGPGGVPTLPLPVRAFPPHAHAGAIAQQLPPVTIGAPQAGIALPALAFLTQTTTVDQFHGVNLLGVHPNSSLIPNWGLHR